MVVCTSQSAICQTSQWSQNLAHELVDSVITNHTGTKNLIISNTQIDTNNLSNMYNIYTTYHNSPYPFWSSLDNLVRFLPLLKKKTSFGRSFPIIKKSLNASMFTLDSWLLWFVLQSIHNWPKGDVVCAECHFNLQPWCKPNEYRETCLKCPTL